MIHGQDNLPSIVDVGDSPFCRAQLFWTNSFRFNTVSFANHAELRKSRPALLAPRSIVRALQGALLLLRLPKEGHPLSQRYPRNVRMIPIAARSQLSWIRG